ncbi:MAG: HEAT repeat domain-containing protein [Deltaproteobacteria bacterium]|nr:HEAT repeat domain-containing protein [Deltaproteobacteria bacterium]
MAQRSFKTDESFLEKLAIGAIGTRKVLENLTQQGHKPVELERGSTGYKIWKSIKIKRIRVPDILCINSGIRVESRAKTKLVISMSHSSADETRGWDFGLKDEDYVALVVCERNGDEPVDWVADNNVQYIQVADLRKAIDSKKVIQERPKGAQEGFETRLTWPCSVASSDGKVIEISKRIKFKRQSDNRTISLALSKKGIELTPCVSVGQTIKRYQILASVSPVSEEVPIRSIELEPYYRELLSSTSISDRYGAAKAYSFLNHKFDTTPLEERIKDDAEHIYIKLESAAALARSGSKLGYDFIESVLSSDYLEHRLEAVIILGELPSEQSSKLLIQVLAEETQHEEIRGGAAWALGELNIKSSIPSLVQAFNEVSLSIRIEAARSLKKMCNSHIDLVLDFFRNASEEERPGVSWALGKYGKWDLENLIEKIDPESLDMRQWGAYIIGNSEPNRIINKIEELKQNDPQLYFAVTVLWKITSSWVNQLKEY